MVINRQRKILRISKFIHRTFRIQIVSLQHGSRDIIKQVLPQSSETAFRWGYYNSPADPDRQSYTQVLEAFLKAGFRIEGSSGAGSQGLLRAQYILVRRSS